MLHAHVIDITITPYAHIMYHTLTPCITMTHSILTQGYLAEAQRVLEAEPPPSKSNKQLQAGVFNKKGENLCRVCSAAG